MPSTRAAATGAVTLSLALAAAACGGGSPTGGAPMCLVKVVGQDGGMTIWFRTYYEDEDLWLFFEADDEG
ncbi:hypothetical protein ACWEWI_39020 [Streptomyces sp. NPDC003753]